MVLPLLPIISMALPFVQKFVPSLVGKLLGDKGEEVATKVIDTAKQITGIDDEQGALNAIEKNPEKFLPLFMKELDVEIEEIRSFTAVQQALAQADATGNTTRPHIALLMAWVVAIVVFSFSVMWVYCISADQVTMITAMKDSWPLMLTVLGTPTALLRAYFGMRTKEKKARYALAGGNDVNGGLLASLFKK